MTTDLAVHGTETTRRSAAEWLAVVGITSAAVYLSAFTLRWPLWRLYDQPNLDYTWISRYTPEGQAVFLGAFALLFALQYVAYHAVKQGEDGRLLPLILGGQIGFGLLLVGIYPVAALDVYDYLMYGRIVLVYGGNPFIKPPAEFADPLVGFSPWPREPTVYGPIWLYLSLVPTALASGSLLAGLVLFKLTALASYVGCSLVIWRLLCRLRPTLAPAGTLLFAWNPLLQFELAGNAHNDAAMVLFVLFAIWALVAGPRLLVFPLLGAAVLTKLLAVALGPIFLIALLRVDALGRHKAVWVLGGGLIALVLAVLLYAPFWEGTRTLHFLTRGNWFTASFPTLLREYFRQTREFEDAGRLAATFTGATFTLYVLARLGWWWRSGRGVPANGLVWDGWLSAAHDVTFAYLAFACIWWEPWYLTWLVALAALLPNRLLHDRALLFCYGGVLNYVVFKYVWSVFQPMTYTTIMGLSVVAIFGLPLLHLLSTLAVERTSASWREPS